MLLITLAVGCSTAPPELPPDYNSIRPSHSINEALFLDADLSKSCEQIHAEDIKIDEAILLINEDIEDGRASDQTIAYLFGAFTMLFDTNDGVRKQLMILHERKDLLRALKKYKKC